METYIIGGILISFAIREIMNYREIRKLKFQKATLVVLCDIALAKLRKEKRKNAYKKKVKMLARFFVISSVVFNVAVANPSNPTCEEVLEACALYVGVLKEEREGLNVQIKEQDEQIVKLQSEVKPEPIPWYWYVVGGVLSGALIWEIK